MAKTLTIKDPVSGESYTLEYTRKTVETVSYTHLTLPTNSRV